MSTEETTNACRACRLLLGPCTDQLRDVLRRHVPPSTFQHVIVQKISNLPRLTVPQLNLILPRGSTYAGNYSDMDIPLLNILLRNICGIPPHNNGWGNDPDPTDRSLSANIERICIARNHCLNLSSPILSNADFNTIWSTVRSAVVDLDSFLNNGNHFEKEVDFLRHETMDPVDDHHYLEELRNQAEENIASGEIVDGLKRKLEERDTDRIESQNKMLKIIDDISIAAVPPNVKAIHEIDMLQWKEDDKVYYESYKFHEMLEKVKNQTHVTFVGVPGSGKTATARHIALMLQQEGYEIVPIRDIRKIEDYCDPNNPQVFVLDDVVGVFGLEKTKLNLLHDYQDRIMTPVMSKSKTIMTCREAVYRKTIESSSFFTDQSNIVLLHSEKFALTNTDKTNILIRYNIDVGLLSPSLTSVSRMFPYLCKLFSSEKKFQLYGSAFFKNPVPCILKELEEMKKQNKVHYASLVLCTMNENKISEKFPEEIEKKAMFQNFNEMKNNVLLKCKLSRQTDNFRFVDALSHMKGTYTKLCDTEYSLVHDSMFEIVAYHFGCQFPELILQFMSSSYIANNVKLQKYENQEFLNKYKNENSLRSRCEQVEEDVAFSCESKVGMESFDLCIRLTEDQYSLLAERLYKDVENMELFNVFTNNVLKQRKVCKAFTEVLKRKPYTELKSLFLLEQNDASKVVSIGECVIRKEHEERDKAMNEFHRQMVLINMRKPPLRKRTHSVRVISWVVYYGHSEILQYIFEQTERHKETQSKVFLNPFHPALSFIIKKGEKITAANNETDNLCPLKPWSDSINQSVCEQRRLLILSCYSGDLETFKIFIKHVNLDKIIREHEHSHFDEIWNDTPLAAACERGEISIVKVLLEAGADVNPQSMHKTPLTAAAESGHTNVVKELLKAGADVNPQDKYDIPLTAACRKGHLCVVKQLLDAAADVNPESANETPLTEACFGGHINVVKELVNAGADVNVHGLNTPLTEACESGQISLVKYLLEIGADVNGLSNQPLRTACKCGHLDVVKALLAAGADVNLQDHKDTPLTEACKEGHMSVVKVLLEAGADVNLKGLFYTPLTAACEKGHFSLVKELLQVGADVNLQGENTPLTEACKCGHIDIVKELLMAGADVNPQGEDYTPLTEGCRSGHMGVVKELLQAGADINLPGAFETPLTAACEAGHLSIVNELLKAGADVNPQGENGSPLIAACKYGHKTIVNILLESGAHVNPQGTYITPLTAACTGGHLSIVKDLLLAEADVNLKDKSKTPLVAACRGGHINVVKILLETGADVNPQVENDSPLTAACLSGRMSVMKILLEAGAVVNIKDSFGRTLLYQVILFSTDTLKPALLMLNSYGADSTLCTEDGLSALCIALVRGQFDVLKQLVNTEDRCRLINLNLHLYECLVNIRQGAVVTDSKDDVVVTRQRVWHINKLGDLYKTITHGKYYILRHLLDLGLDSNQMIQLYRDFNNESDVRPLLFTLVDEGYVNDRVEKVRILLEAGTDVNFRVRYNEQDSTLDRWAFLNLSSAFNKGGVSILERTWRL
ncbi:uncharacterized protein LOC134280023 [Saccostrea cucullata]|uniref:uncharacterized protein LOC134280023 n=1 Tax=Saccostrea cuccullata TaxID=36930 RepID=UPI002ED26CE3